MLLGLHLPVGIRIPSFIIKCKGLILAPSSLPLWHRKCWEHSDLLCWSKEWRQDGDLSLGQQSFFWEAEGRQGSSSVHLVIKY